MSLEMRKDKKKASEIRMPRFLFRKKCKYFHPVIKRAILAVVGRFPVRKELPSAEE